MTGRQTAADLLVSAAARDPRRPAIVFHGRAITYGELDELADRTAAALAGFGVRPGDRVALLAGNVPEFVTVLNGAWRAGAVACPLNVALTGEEIGYILADARARVVVTELNALPAVLSVRDRLADLHAILVIGGPPAAAGTVSLEEVLGAEAPGPEVAGAFDQLALLAYTSGTTASPRGAMLTHANLLANLDQLGSVPRLANRPEDVVLLAIPVFHIYGLNVALGMAVRAGATSVLVDRFDPVEALDLIARHRVTVLPGVPPMFAAWLAASEEGTVADLSSVRLAASGASALPGEVLTRFDRRFGVTIWEGYGLTEAGPAVTTSAMGHQAKPGSIGLPLPGLEVRLVDEGGEDTENEDPGEIWVRGPNVFAGYWGRPAETAEVMADGWLRTGDIAVRDEDGYLFLVDRKRDLIIVSGFNVYPREVEEAIGRHPDVAEAAVVAMPDERTGEAVRAWVVPAAGAPLSADAILAFLEGYLARFKWPKEIRIVDELPHHVTGKVLRRALRADEALDPDEVDA